VDLTGIDREVDALEDFSIGDGGAEASDFE
jgi:hypothetical protein